ncbi:molecular chaperone TorD [Desulfococcaceae bacterium HSG9]|nr:molecular chaperone TorD [Desulfococcaceae bacterium HSG9]
MNDSEQSTPNPRSCMYRLLASLYARELTQENIIGFQAGPGRKLLDALETVETYAPLVIHLKKHFAEITDPKQAVLDLAESYSWNFHGVAGPHAAHLYASVYLSENGITHREIERELHNILREHGLSSVNYEREPCDHLSVILEFVSWLDEQAGTEQQQDAWQKTQKIIIEKYLLTWLPEFVAKCKQGDRLGFYSALAEETLAFVEADFKQIQ